MSYRNCIYVGSTCRSIVNFPIGHFDALEKNNADEEPYTGKFLSTQTASKIDIQAVDQSAAVTIIRRRILT
jgi:hypothetical protein